MDGPQRALGALDSRQAIVTGDVSLEIPAWNRNYVSEGGGSTNLGDAIPPARSLPFKPKE